MNTTPKVPPGNKPKLSSSLLAPRKLSKAIKDLAREFMLKPDACGFDAVGELVKARRGA